jgi:Ca-activated chloride channel homolog
MQNHTTRASVAARLPVHARAALVVGAAALFVGSSSAQQQPTFSARTEAVRLDVLVTRDNRPFQGLKQEDFEVYDDGVKQDVTLISLEKLPLNVVLALDVSDSVMGERLGRLQEASRAFVDALRADDQAGLLTFNDRVSLAAPITTDRGRLVSAIGDLRAGGGTALNQAVHASIVLAEQSGGRGLSIVFTDGEDTVSYLPASRAIDLAKRSEVVVYAVAITSAGQMKPLRSMTEQSGGSLLVVEWDGDLRNTFVKILDEFRVRYLLSYTPKGSHRKGWHTIDVRAKGPGLRVHARPGYQAD